MKDEQKTEPVWCVRANVVQERPYGPGGLEIRRGTKHFAPGAKVYCTHVYWDGPMTSVEVVGHHRGSHRYVKMIIGHERLTNFRAELVYSPYIIEQLPATSGSPESKLEVEKAVSHLLHLSGAGQSEPAV